MSRGDYIRALNDINSKLDEYLTKYDDKCYRRSKNACEDFKKSIEKNGVKETDTKQLYLFIVDNIDTKLDRNEELLNMCDKLEFLLYKL